ncbi:MAG: tyrosine-type recombinase/integrase [Actinomycetota bacterium]|nr:tyrosine-type recombinase/integrase [Actinomycetota bacterium]
MKGHVTRKGDVWYAVIYNGVDPITGKERRTWHRAGTDRAEAEALAARLAAVENTRRNGHRSKLTVAGFITRYWLPAKRLDLEASTFDGYQRVIRLHLLPHIGDIALRGLRTERLEQLYGDLLDHGNTLTGEGLSPKTVLDVHVIIRAALDDAIHRGLLRGNPAKAAHAPKHQRNRCRADRVWTADQLMTFLHLVDHRRQHPSFWLAANTGMRRGELLGLRWDAIDTSQRRLSVSRTVVSVDSRPQESGGKTRNSPRTIDLDTSTLGVLANWRRRQIDELGTSDDTMPLHTKTDGILIHPQTLSQAFDRAVATTTLPRISLHDLRHTHATLLLKAGVPLKVVSERLGHSSPAFTMATYQHILPGMQADAAATFAALLQNPPSNGFYPEETR